MPLATRLAIRLALGWLVVGMAMGVVVAAARAGLLPPRSSLALMVHIPAVLVGWFAQLVIGVAYWMMPKYGRSDARWPRGPERPFLAAIVALNVALLIAVLGRFVGPGLVRVGAVAVLASFAACAAQIWPRVKAFGR